MEDRTNEKKDCLRRSGVLLAQRDYTCRRLKEKLLSAGFKEEIVEETLQDLKAARYLDDARYAENFVNAHREDRSRMRMRSDLENRGVPPEVIAATKAAIAAWTAATIACMPACVVDVICWTPAVEAALDCCQPVVTAIVTWFIAVMATVPSIVMAAVAPARPAVRPATAATAARRPPAKTAIAAADDASGPASAVIAAVNGRTAVASVWKDTAI